MSYKEEKLVEYIDILSGYAFKTRDFTDKGIPIIKIKNICSPCVSLDDLSFVSNETAALQKKYELSYDDVLIAMTGSHINQWASVVGRVARVKYNQKTLLNQRVGKITVKDSNKANIDYIYYFLSQDSIKIELAAKAGGAANQANISPTQIKDLYFPCPEISKQNKIANTLRSYDDLIENNQKQIKLLEEAAQRLYKEWFVDLRFPGYKNVKVVDGVPEGWKIEKIGNFVSTTSGGTPSRTHKEYYESGTNLWVKTQELKDSYIIDTDEKITDEAIKKSSAKIIPNGSLLLAMYGATIGKLGIANCDLTCNQACCVFLFENDIWKREYLYCWLIENRVFLVSQGKGAAQPNLSQALIKAIDILIPNENLVKRFSKIASVMFQKKCNLEIQIKSLNEARDRLLPKLMSGELEV